MNVVFHGTITSTRYLRYNINTYYWAFVRITQCIQKCTKPTQIVRQRGLVEVVTQDILFINMFRLTSAFCHFGYPEQAAGTCMHRPCLTGLQEGGGSSSGHRKPQHLRGRMYRDQATPRDHVNRHVRATVRCIAEQSNWAEYCASFAGSGIVPAGYKAIWSLQSRALLNRKSNLLVLKILNCVSSHGREQCTELQTHWRSLVTATFLFLVPLRWLQHRHLAGVLPQILVTSANYATTCLPMCWYQQALTPKMETGCSSEMSVATYRTAIWCHNWEDHNLNRHGK
jgi:hypothetical protein